MRAALGRPGARLGGLGPAVRSAFGRFGVRRLAPQERAAGMLLPTAARELADADGRELQRRLLGRSSVSRELPADVRGSRAADGGPLPRTRMEPHALPLLLQRQEQLQGQRLVARLFALAARRA